MRIKYPDKKINTPECKNFIFAKIKFLHSGSEKMPGEKLTVFLIKLYLLAQSARKEEK
ncbi:Uncharacterized protein dnm_081680 [Desulfonema magnum]|uniref:Uncharacterized protein n=1 Tax=Desulfonema magnum TaxID=45655 RepID=A0A975BUY2_9BACT|nr:Uncharacterized protein dnm_081680 [Desulfonema magnum]